MLKNCVLWGAVFYCMTVGIFPSKSEPLTEVSVYDLQLNGINYDGKKVWLRGYLGQAAGLIVYATSEDRTTMNTRAGVHILDDEAGAGSANCMDNLVGVVGRYEYKKRQKWGYLTEIESIEVYKDDVIEECF